MSHSAAGWRRLSANESDHGFLYLGFDVGGSFFFRGAANLPDHDDATSLRIFIEQTDRVDEVRPDDGIAANANARRLAELPACELAHGFIGQSAAARDNADVSFKMNMPGHDPDLAPARRDDARAVGPDQSRLLPFKKGCRADHVEGRHTLGNTNDQIDAGIRGFHDRVSSERWWNKDDGRVGAGLAAGFVDAVEDIDAFMFDAALTWGDAADNLRSVVDSLQRVKRSFFSRESLD